MGLVLVGGLAWFWFSGDLSGTGPQLLEPSAPGVATPDPGSDASVAAIPELNESDDGRAGMIPNARGADRAGFGGGDVTLTVRAEDGRTMREALASWGLARHRFSCVGTRRSPGIHTYGSISAAKPPHLFATVGPELVDGETTFTVLVTERPRFLSVLFAGVVIATERVSKGETEILVELSESDVRSALGSIHLCMVGGPGPAVRARAYLRGTKLDQLTAETDKDGCLNFRDVAPGEYQLSGHANRFASYFATLQVEPSNPLDLGDITLQPPVHLAGMVKGQKRFAANRQIAIQSIDRNGPKLAATELRRVSTDGKGKFRVFDLPAGEYALRVIVPPAVAGSTRGNWPVSRPVLVDTRKGPRQDVELELEDAHGVVVRNGLELDVNLDIRTGAGVSVANFRLGGKGVRHVSLLPGSYLFVAESHGEEVDRRTLRTPPSMTAIIGG